MSVRKITGSYRPLKDVHAACGCGWGGSSQHRRTNRVRHHGFGHATHSGREGGGVRGDIHAGCESRTYGVQPTAVDGVSLGSRGRVERWPYL